MVPRECVKALPLSSEISIAIRAVNVPERRTIMRAASGTLPLQSIIGVASHCSIVAFVTRTAPGAENGVDAVDTQSFDPGNLRCDDCHATGSAGGVTLSNDSKRTTGDSCAEASAAGKTIVSKTIASKTIMRTIAPAGRIRWFCICGPHENRRISLIPPSLLHLRLIFFERMSI